MFSMSSYLMELVRMLNNQTGGWNPKYRPLNRSTHISPY